MRRMFDDLRDCKFCLKSEIRNGLVILDIVQQTKHSIVDVLAEEMHGSVGKETMRPTCMRAIENPCIRTP